MDDIHRMARTAQDRRQAIGQCNIVFGEQDAQRMFPGFFSEFIRDGNLMSQRFWELVNGGWYLLPFIMSPVATTP
jgi:hypothetical protein